VGNEPFAVILADDLIEEGSRGCLNEMIPLFNMTQSSVIAVETIQPSESKKYGIVTLFDETKKHHRISSIVEKPEPINAPSNLGVVGRYILQPSIFKALEETRVGANGEIQLTDAISRLLPKEAVYAYYLRGERYDCGSKLGYLQATINYALHHPELAEQFRAYLRRQ
jgi:UTP--glucose-1-phosphate uridylyltransferase